LHEFFKWLKTGVQSDSQFTVEIRKRKSVVYEVAVLEIGKSRVHAEQASISGGREPLASKGMSLDSRSVKGLHM
jgi:hypothetical protein